jgi:murein DD-endopeptidase MepM/ murein hydrolase activator NlpD
MPQTFTYEEAMGQAPSARQPSPVVAQPQQRSVWERLADDYTDAASRSLVGYAVRRGADLFDWKRQPGETEEQHDARIVEAERSRRAEYGARNAADPSWQADGSFLGNVGRAVGSFGAGVLGGADPTYLLGPGRLLGQTARGRISAMTGIEAGADLLTQGAEINEGVADSYDPMRTVWSAAAGAGFQGGLEGLRRIWPGRGTTAPPDMADPDLLDVTLDGAPMPGGGGLDVETTLRGAGYSSEMFSTPELAQAMAERISAARGRTPNVPPGILAERDDLARGIELGDVDPSLQPPPLETLRPVVPEGVTMTASPEFGTARSDDLGSLIAQLRYMAGRQNVIDQARGMDNPTLDAIMSANANLDQQAGTIWARIAELDRMNRTAPEGVPRLDPNAPEVPPMQRSTVEAAAGQQDAIVLPVQGRVSSKMGKRGAPTKGASTNHGGVDIAAPRGTAVRAPAGGTVIMAGEAGANGNLVRIDHGNGVVSSYAHLDGFDVKMGDKVEAGQSFGRVGSTGRSTGPHLHYEIRENGQRVDPLGYRFKQPEQSQTDFVVPTQTPDPFETPSSFERTTARRSPTNEEMEAGQIFEQPGGIFTEGPRGRPFDFRMSTRGNQPRRPVADDPEAAPPGYNWRDEGGNAGEGPAPAPDSPSPGGGPRSGPGSGKGFWDDRMQQQMDEMLRQYEASQSQRRERQQQQRNQERPRDPGERYSKYGQKPAQGDGGFWRMTDDGMIADADGNPVAFRDQKEAAKFAVRNNLGGDFELEMWATNSSRTILRRRGNSTYGQARPEGEAAPGADEAAQAGPEAGQTGFRRPQTFERDVPPAGRSQDRSQRALPDGDQDPAQTSLSPEAPETSSGGGLTPASAAAPSAPTRTTPPQGAAPPRTAPRSQPAGAPARGNTERVVTARGREIDTEFEVREARDVITSDDARFDQARQPRDRSRSASDTQIAEIAAKLDPQQLRGNRQASSGAPIIGPDGMVEVGNGRTMAIRRAYEQGGERADAYRKMLADEGYDVEGFDQPILVRKRTTELSPDDMRAWVNEAQDSGTMRYSAPEQARADSGAISDGTLSLYRGGEINSAGNREFVRAWMRETGADANSVTAKDGSLSLEGLNRVRASVLAKAFDDDTLVSKLLGDSDNNIKAIGNVLLDLAPKFAEVRAMAKSGEIPAKFDVSGKIGEMAGLISRSREEGKKLVDLVNQVDAFSGRLDASTESLVRLMFKDDDLLKPRSQVRLKEGLDFYLEDAKAQANGPAMFDDVPELSPQDILEAARAKLNAKDSGGNQSSMFKITTSPSKAARARSTDLDTRLQELRADADPDQRQLIDRLLNVPDARAGITEGDIAADDVNPGKFVAGEADIDRNTMQLRDAEDVETLLHEAVHLRLMRRYGEEFDELRPGDAGEMPARELVELYNKARSRHGKYGAFNKSSAGHTVEYALSSVDEFIAEAMTSKTFQRWLQRGTMWESLVDGFRKLLGMPKRFTPMLDDVLRSGRQLLDAAAVDPVRRGSGPSAPALGGFARKGQVRKIIDKDGLSRDRERLRAVLGNPKQAADAIARRLKDGIGWAMFSNDGRGRAIADRIESDAAHELMDNFFARPGARNNEGVGETYFEAIQRYGGGRAQQAYRALGDISKNEPAMRRVADLLRYPNRKSRATQGEIDAAKKLRELFKETIEYRRAAGESIGEVTDGYFPRWIDTEKVIGDLDAFKGKAASMYRKMGMSTREADDQAQSWSEHIIDTYAGLDAGLDIFNVAGDTIGSRTAQSREFGKMADTILADFYQNDVLAVSAQYFHGSARRAEQFRRFGKKGAEGSAERKAWEKLHGEKTQLDVLEDRIRDDARKHGAEGAGAMGVLRSIYGNNMGRIRSGMSNKQRAAMSWAHTWTQLGVMDRTTITSLAELFAGAYRGGPRQALPFMGESIKQFVRQVRRAPADDAQRWAESLGVAQDAIVNTALTARASIEGGTERSQKVLQGFYEGVGLHQFTEATRIASVKMGRELLRQWSFDAASSSARVASRGRKYLAEVGIKNPEAFAKVLREKGDFDMAEVAKANGDFANQYGTAIIRISNQTIMRPTRAEKPVWSAHPVGGMFFSLMSYSYGFKKNVLDRTARLGKAAVQERDPLLLAPALGLAGMVAFQGAMDTYVRPALFGGAIPEDESPMQTGLRVADRGGLTGGLSPLVNAMTGVRYQRGLSESLAGPVIGRPLDMGTALIALSVNNSENTNTTERRAAGLVYDNTLEPAMDGLAAARLLGAARTAAIMGTGTRNDEGVLPSDREAFIEAFAGPKEEE